jgi:DNA-binding MarR family transcriptional regulator/N-acetylglutamate synthase-like GNAT family acetyltransferase
VPVAESTLAAPVSAIRRFNRFYTKHIGVLREGHLDSPFSLTEVRVLYELAHQDGPTAAELTRELGLDSGYLSRILRGFERRELVEKTRSEVDARQAHLRLTEAGRAAFAGLDSRADEEIVGLVERVAHDDRHRLTDAMRTIERVLAPRVEARPSYLIRTHQPGDIGWVVFRHGVLYAREYGWDERFEALVAQIVAEFVHNFDARRERCWIAEVDGERVGSVFLVKKSDTVAKLRLLLVEPTARGLGIGHRLVDECIRFARLAQYRRITLWTNSVLHAARRIYEQAGFRLVSEEPHAMFGVDLTGQTWELDL